MTCRKYKVVIEFTYKDGTTGGELETIVNSKKAVEIQLEADQSWLAAKGHSVISIRVQGPSPGFDAGQAHPVQAALAKSEKSATA